MFNLLRMDLYRIKRSKSLYVCLGVMLFMMVMVMGMVWLVATPQGQDTALHIGMLSPEDLKDGSSMLEGENTLSMFRQNGMDGGSYSLIFGIWVMLFVCADYQNGFIKNIMALHQNRWNYVGSKVLAAGVVNLFYLLIQFLFLLLLNQLFGIRVPCTGWKDVLFYLSWVWLLTTAFAALIILICVITRSVAAGALAAVFLGTGSLVMPLYGILQQFRLGEWLKYTIYMTMNRGADQYHSLSDLSVYLIGVVFLLRYGGLAGVILRKQDI